jgi:hypothetical protein
MQNKPLVGQRVAVIKHVHEGRVLVELRVIRDNERETADYGVRQAWIYTYPEEEKFVFHYTTREDIIRLLKAYPDLKNLTTLLFTTAEISTPKFMLEDIHTACEILRSFLSDPSDVLPGISGNVETHLPQRND